MWVEVCSTADVEEGRPLRVDVEDRQLIVVKLDDGYHALDGICTHEYAELWLGFISGDTITCPLHLSQFSLRTGEVVSPPADQALRIYPVRVDNNKILVDV